jgi:acyl-CoA synthetase (AMP-forming)/AMP-acid ligase II
MQEPLLQGYAPGAPAGWRDGKAVSVEQFLAVAAALARRLPQGGYCINTCEDRLNFLAGFAAALITRSVTLLPQSRAPKVLRELVADYSGAYRLADADIGAWQDGLASADIPAIARDQVAVILFTSGTTGTPRPHAKSWGSLVAGARALRARVPEIAGASIVGAVPPQHMWGLESTIMLALQSGCAVDVSCPLLPAEIARRPAGATLAGGDAGAPARLCAVGAAPASARRRAVLHRAAAAGNRAARRGARRRAGVRDLRQHRDRRHRHATQRADTGIRGGRRHRNSDRRRTGDRAWWSFAGSSRTE